MELYRLRAYHQNYCPGLPVVSFRFTDEFRQQHPDIQQKWVQVLLRAKGWIVPNYELAPDLENVEILRVVVREQLTATMIDRLVADIVRLSFACALPATHILARWRSSIALRRRIVPHTRWPRPRTIFTLRSVTTVDWKKAPVASPVGPMPSRAEGTVERRGGGKGRRKR